MASPEVEAAPPHDRQLSRAVAAGVTQGIQTALKDEELVKAFWKKGFEEITSHAASGASMWVGRRVLVWFITAAFGIVLFLAVKYKVLS